MTSLIGVPVGDLSDRPRRIQLSRAAGWRKPAGAVVVARPSRWGNPWRVGMVIGADFDDEHYDMVGAPLTAELAVGLYRAALLAPDRVVNTITGLDITVDEVRAELRGRDLCCWCPLDGPCHADVLLEVANA